MKVGDIIKMTREDVGRLVLLVKSRGQRSYILGKDVGELFLGVPLDKPSMGPHYHVFETAAEVVSEGR